MEKWRGRVALVSGASAGIGPAICENLVKNGMKVVGIARRLERMQELAEKLKNQEGSFLPIKCDVTKDEEVYTLFDKIKETFGGVDVCVNNAGYVGTGLGLLNGNPEEWRQMSNINVIAVCLLSKLTVKSLRERGLDDGHIININSVGGHYVFPIPYMYFYTGTKYALRALSEGLRQELQATDSGIKVSSVSPGIVKTEILDSLSQEYNHYRKILDLNKSLKPEDIAQVVFQILSAPSYMEINDIIVAPQGRMKTSFD